MVAWAALGSIAGSLINGLFNTGSSAYSANQQYKNQSKLNKQTYQYNLKLQKHQNAFSQRMFDQSAKLASQAHQIEVSDMRAAGLNPILSATGGSGATVVSPMSGGSAGMSGGSAQSVEPGKIDLINAFNSAKQVKNDTQRVKNETELVPIQKDKMQYEADSAHENAAYTNEQNRQYQIWNPKIQQAQLDLLRTQEANFEANTARTLNAINNDNLSTQSTVQTNKSTQAANYSSAGSHPYKDIHSNIIAPIVNSAKSGNLTYKNLSRSFNRNIHHFFTGSYGHY